MLKKYSIPLFLLLGFIFLIFQLFFKSPSVDLSLLSPVAQRVLKKVLREQVIKSVQPLQGGFSSSKLYKIDTITNSYVLRVIDPKRSLADRDREIKCMQIASAEDIAPKVYFASVQEGMILMDFIQNRPLSKEEQSPKIRLPRLGTILRKLHNGPAFPKTVTPLEEIRRVTAELAVNEIKLPNLVKEALAHLENLKIPLEKTAKLSPCHNDLNPNNILFAGEAIKIIDWEGAGMGDPYFDLAEIALFFTFDPKDEEYLLESYFGAPPTQAQKNRLYVMKQVSLCFCGLALLRASVHQKVSPLSSGEIDALPGFSKFLMGIGEGKEKMDSPLFMQRFAFTAFKQAFHNMKTKEFSIASESILRMDSK